MGHTNKKLIFSTMSTLSRFSKTMKMVRCTRECVAPSGNPGRISLPTGILLAALKSRRLILVLLCSFLFVGADGYRQYSKDNHDGRYDSSFNGSHDGGDGEYVDATVSIICS